MKITLDPGHGRGYNKGVVSGYYEGTRMHEFSQVLTGVLQARGWTVKTTRPGVNDDPSLSSRAATGVGCDLLLSLHTNAPGGNNPQVRGVKVFRSVKRPQDDKLGKMLTAAMAKAMNTKDSGIELRYSETTPGQDYYGLLRNAVNYGVMALILESGFHTNPDDCAWWMDDNNLPKAAEAIAGVLDAYYNLKPVYVEINRPGFVIPGDGMVRIDDASGKNIGWVGKGEAVQVNSITGNKANITRRDTTGNIDASMVVYGDEAARIGAGGPVRIDDETGKNIGWVYSGEDIRLHGEAGGKAYITRLQTRGFIPADRIMRTVIITRLLKHTNPMMRGDDVRWLQQRLLDNGVNPGGIDGVFGENTKGAVRVYQSRVGLASDGMAGKDTVTRLGGKWEG